MAIEIRFTPKLNTRHHLHILLSKWNQIWYFVCTKLLKLISKILFISLLWLSMERWCRNKKKNKMFNLHLNENNKSILYLTIWHEISQLQFQFHCIISNENIYIAVLFFCISLFFVQLIWLYYIFNLWLYVTDHI